MESLRKKNYAKIYVAFGGNAAIAPDTKRTDFRMPIITSINNAIRKQFEKIYDAERVIVTCKQKLRKLRKH